jgi:hypothetical protein
VAFWEWLDEDSCHWPLPRFLTNASVDWSSVLNLPH